MIIAPHLNGQIDTADKVLDAFEQVELSMNKSGLHIDKLNKEMLDAIEADFAKRPDIVGPYHAKAKHADMITKDFIKYIDDLMKLFEVAASGRKNQNPDEAPIDDEDIESHGSLFVKQGKGAELKYKINETRNKLLNLLDDDVKKTIRSDLWAEDYPKSKQTWEQELFEHAPAAAVVTLLTKIKNDARNTEAQVLMAIAKYIDRPSIPFDVLEARIIPKSGFVIYGGKFEADIILVAYDSNQNSDVIVNGRVIKTENGVAKFEEIANGNGEHTVKGYIDYIGETGNQQLPFETTYNVFKGQASIVGDKLDMLYIGLENPISISVPGFPPENVVATMVGGILVKTRGTSYIATVTTRGEATISVAVRVDDGSLKQIGKTKFRVRSIPKPETLMGTLGNGDVQSKGTIRANATRLKGSLGEGFPFEWLKYTVVSYDFLFVPKKGETKSISCTGEELPEEVQKIITGINSGDKIIFDRIKATGPDGTRNLSPIVITAL